MKLRPAPKMAAGWLNLDAEGFELDSVLPGQYDGQLPKWSPEQQLQAAVLADAVRCYRKGKFEAMRWFRLDQPSYPFSFASVCASLRLSQSAFLRALRKDQQ